jgi:hypothetical protein
MRAKARRPGISQCSACRAKLCILGNRFASGIIPAQAGIQYPSELVIGTEALEYWVARLRGR